MKMIELEIRLTSFYIDRAAASNLIWAAESGDYNSYYWFGNLPFWC